MKNIIEELWNGERGPQDTLVNNNPHYKELQHLQARNKLELLESLSEEQKEKLEKYCDTTLEMNSASEREAFASGFRIARERKTLGLFIYPCRLSPMLTFRPLGQIGLFFKNDFSLI